MSTHETRLLDEAGLDRLIRELADRIEAGRRPGVPLQFVGVRSRGVPIARRLAEQVGRNIGAEVPVGAVDITLYRDDLDRRRRWPVLKGTDIPFGVDDREIVLVDDVVSTGRTARAALNAVCDLGRPETVRLAVVVDRGGRELPIQPDYVARSIQVEPGQKIVVRVRPIDEVEGILCVETGGPT